MRVQVPVERAFSVFVERMETWWPAAEHIGARPFQTIFVEPRAGRWYERDARGNECDWGRVLSWEPPHRIRLSRHPHLTRPGTVEIRFIAEGSSTTVVQLEHTGVDPAPLKPNWVLHVGAIPMKVTQPPVVMHRWEEILAEFGKVAR